MKISGIHIGENGFLSRVMQGHLVLAASLFAEANEVAATIELDVSDIDRNGSSDAGKCVKHQRDQPTISEPADSVGRNRIQQVPGIRWLQHRRFAFHDDGESKGPLF